MRVGRRTNGKISAFAFLALALSALLLAIGLHGASAATATDTNLSISVSGPASVRDGASFDYTISVTNRSDATATGVRLAMTLSGGGVTLGFPDDCSASFSGGEIRIGCGSIAAGATRTFALHATAVAPGSGTVTVTVSADQSDPDTSDNTASATTTIEPGEPGPELSATVGGVPATAFSGETIDVVFTVTNDGAGSATNLGFHTFMPMPVVSAGSSVGACTVFAPLRQVTCPLGELAAGGSATVTLTLAVSGNGPAEIRGTFDADEASAAHASATTVVDPTDLRSDVTGPASGLTHEPLVYTATVTNDGPDTSSAALDVTVSNGDITSVTPSSGNCGTSGAGSWLAGCGLGPLPSGESRTVTIVVTTGETRPITVRTVAGASFDTNTANNAATTTTSISANPNPPPVDLAVSISGPASVRDGAAFEYTISVTNESDGIATGVELVGAATGGVSVGFPDDCSGSGSGGTQFTSICGSIAAGATRTFALDATAVATGSGTVTVTVGSDLPDPDTSDNTASTTTTLEPGPELGAAVSGVPATVLSGETIDVVFTVTNSGAGAATNVRFSGFMPMSVVSVTSDAGACTVFPTTRQISCQLGDLATGASHTVTVRLTASGHGPVAIRGTFDADEGSPVHSSATTLVDPIDVSAAVTGPATGLTGEPLVYTATFTNHGPTATSAGLDVFVTNAGIDSVTPSSGNCGTGGTSLAGCGLGNVPAGESRTVSITVSSGVANRTITIRVVAGASTAFDVDTANNTATATAVVRTPADVHVAPAALDFGTLQREATGTQAITIRNVGGSVLSVGSISDPSAPYSVSGAPTLPATLAPGGELQLEVACTPTSLGSFPASVSIGSDDADEPSVSVALSCAAENAPPVADAGGPYDGSEGAGVGFDGNASTDVDGPASGGLTYSWDFGDGTSASEPDPTHAYADDGTYTVTLTVTDADGATDTATATTTIANARPVVDSGAPREVDEAATLVLDASFTDAGADDGPHTATIDWGDGTVEDVTAAEAAHDLSASHAYADDGAYTAMWTVTDKDGGRGTAEVVVKVLNVAPAVDAGVNRSADEGAAVTIAPVVSDPASADTHTVTIDWGDGTVSSAPTHSYADDGIYTVTVTAVDDDLGLGADQLLVTVANVAPVLGAVNGPLDPVSAGTVVSVDAPYADAGSADTHVATIDWGDGTSSAGEALDGTARGSHAYAQPGLYTIALTVTDDDGGSDTQTFLYVVVFDPSGGFVTGGGWIVSPAGAYEPDPALTGRASFGFVSRYRRGADVPSGQTQFQFLVADFHFHSTSYDWLVVSGSRARFKGSGQIDGGGDYAFMLTATDGSPDRFRIKIWSKESGAVVYDNQRGAADDADPVRALGGGSVVVHRP